MVTGYHMTPVNSSSVLISAQEYNDGQSNEKISLTSLWDYVIRMQCLPESLDLDAFFDTIHQRLRSPEWEIRQNALRVLVDFMPLLNVDLLDQRLEVILPDIICNLGHLGPAVRKGAVDVLKVYLNLSAKPNAITRDLVERCIEKSDENKICNNVVLGIIISLPYILNNKLNDTTVNYIIHRLLDKIVKVVHQETVLRSLVRIKGLIGAAKFDAALSTHESYTCKNDFELLCGIYDLQAQQPSNPSSESSDLEDQRDKVILETEIQLESGPSITMKIHEENQQVSSPNSSSRSPGNTSTFQVLPDVSFDDSYASLRRTPRRVRFGGEVVKLRTPDSDSNLDENDATISIISEGDQPVIEINYTDGDQKTTTTRVNRSLIPIRISHTQSAPSSPTGKRLTSLYKSKKEYRSSPNLNKKLSPVWGKSRIPRRVFRQKIEVKIEESERVDKDKLKLPQIQTKHKESDPKSSNRSSGKDKTKSSELPVTKKNLKENEGSPSKRDKKSSLPTPKITIPAVQNRRNSREERFSPVPVHNEIELFHNLTRTPSPKFSMQSEPSFLPTNQQEAPQVKETEQSRNLMESSGTNIDKRTENNSTEAPAFYKFASSEEGPLSHELLLSDDSPIPVSNGGECLTCSSSGSETGITGTIERFENTQLDDRIVDDLQNMEDIIARQRGLEELLRVLQTPTVLDSLQERLPSLLYILFSAIQQTTLQSTTEQALNVIFTNMKQEVLMFRLHQICLNLAKLRSPSGTKLAIMLMRRVPPRVVIDQILNDSIIFAKSSKVREGALQIVMTVARLHPSTDLNLPKSLRAVIRSLCDRKRRIRQAALETLAALAQITGNSLVLEIANEVTSSMESPDRQQILQVIRTRLSRKQLPNVNINNGSVHYSSALGDTEIEWLLKGGSGGLSESSTPNSPALFNKRTKNSSANNQREVNEDGNNNRLVTQVERTQRFVQEEYETTTRNRRFVENYSPRASSSKKVNYWKNNPRNQYPHNEKSDESDWPSYEEEPIDGQKLGTRTQLWAIDPSAGFATQTNGKLSSANGTLRQLYVVQHTKDSKSASTNTDNFRHDAAPPPQLPVRRSGSYRSQRGRSFSPPTFNNRTNFQSSDDASNTPKKNMRFISGSHYYKNNARDERSPHENLRKSFSSEHITGAATRFRKEHTFSSGSSSSSSTRQGGWREMRSGIPVPIYDNNKLRIRTRNQTNNSERTKGPMTISYYPNVKSPSPVSTPEKHNSSHHNSANRQPFSSGSESSGYFTPPPESRPEINMTPDLSTPSRTPQVSPKAEHFMRVETPRKLDSEESESFDDDDTNNNSTNLTHDDGIPHEYNSKDPSVRPSSSLTSLDYSAERILSKNENTNSLEFSKLQFEPERQINVEISTQIQRKNVNSAPELLNLSFAPASTSTTTLKTSLPGSYGDSLDETTEPDNLYRSTSPEKKSPVKVVSVKTALRRKSSKYGSDKCHDSTSASGDRPFTKPREAFHEICAQLESPEWEVTMKGLAGLTKLIRHHKDVAENQMHAVCVLLGKHIRNLRSQVARNACHAAMELFKVGRRPLEMELDELATPLLHRTADTNKFLRGDANAALDEMCMNLSVPKLVAVITYRGSLHQNSVVRSASTRLLCNIVQRLGAEKVFQLPRDTRDKILLAGANALMEGSLETRQHAKILLGLLAEHTQFQKAMSEAVPASILRHIDKTMKLLVK